MGSGGMEWYILATWWEIVVDWFTRSDGFKLMFRFS